MDLRRCPAFIGSVAPLDQIGIQLFADNEVVRLATSSLAGGERSC
jgi:hypothetical protein